MTPFDFVTRDEMDELPDDPRMAFTDFVTLAEKRLSERVRDLESRQDEDGWREANECRHAFVNVVIAAGKRFMIDEFSALELPLVDQFSYNDYTELKAKIDHYITQVALDTSIRLKSYSTIIPDNSKDRIRSHLHHLGEAIESSGLSDAKKEKLHKILSEFETELEKRRLSWLAVARLTYEILAVPGTLYASSEVVTKLITNINQTVAEAKAVEDETRAIPNEPTSFALTPPKTPKPKPQTDFGFGKPTDDEIPF